MNTNRSRKVTAWLAALVVSATPGFAGPILQPQFAFPATQAVQKTDKLTSTRLPIGPFQDGTVATLMAEGARTQSVWQIAAADLSTLKVLQDLRQQVAKDSFDILFECETEACGGFDFRFAADVLPEPEMHVDLGDFRYLLAERTGSAGQEFLTLMISRSPQSGFVQVTQIGGSVVELTTSTKSPTPVVAELPIAVEAASVVATPTGNLLDQGQPQVLEDLVFDSGSSSLAAGDYVSLQALAAWLKANPDKTVTLVGHTDASGGLAGNTALSKKRAESVRQVLLTAFAIPAAQIASNGVGPLAPRASNLTPEGQQKNRRVEVLPTPTP